MWSLTSGIDVQNLPRRSPNRLGIVDLNLIPRYPPAPEEDGGGRIEARHARSYRGQSRDPLGRDEREGDNNGRHDYQQKRQPFHRMTPGRG